MKEQKKQPELRFKGFTDDWEQVELSELVTKEKSYSLSRDVESEKETENRYIHYGDIHTGIADKITNKNQLPFIKEDSYEPLLKGDLILADASEDYQGIATPAIILETTKYRIVAGLHTIVLRPSDKCDSLYLYYLLKTKSFKKHGYRMGTGMKVFGITANNVLAFKTLLPSKKEQNKISQLLKIMDRLLTLQQRRLDLLKKLKRGYLQQMFPAKDQYSPRLRFGEFNGDWKQDKAIKLFFPKSKKGFPKLRVLSVTQDSGVVYRDKLDIDIKYNSAALNSYKMVEPGDYVISLRSFQGGFELSDKLGITSPAYTIFVPQETTKHDRQFWKVFFKTYKFIESLKTVTFGIRDGKSISFSEFGDLKLKFPQNITEQQKIGEFFQKLDQAITLQQSKIEHQQQLKQAYLQKLFP